MEALEAQEEEVNKYATANKYGEICRISFTTNLKVQ